MGVFVDADEIVTPYIIDELRDIELYETAQNTCGYFVRGRYIWNKKPLHFGLHNNKLALLNRFEMEFPTVNDLDIVPGLGELEGHYQPVRKEGFADHRIGQLKAPLLHDACTDLKKWQERHQRYALWEDEMDKRNAWPEDITPMRRIIKTIFRAMPPWLRGLTAFTHSFILKLGIMDGVRGFQFACLRLKYYWR